MNKRLFFNIDWGLLAPAIILVILSLITLFSIDRALFNSQFVFFIVGIFAFLFFSQTNYRTVNLYATPIYIVSIVLLITVLLIGVEARGSVRWLEIFGFRVQFSEILKPFLVISLSSYLASKNNYSLKTLFLATCFGKCANLCFGSNYGIYCFWFSFQILFFRINSFVNNVSYTLEIFA